MATLLEIRELAITVYSRYELYIDRLFRFVAVLSWLLVVNGQIGYRETLTGVVPTLLISLICTLLPMGGVVVILALLVLLHLYALSIEAALVGALLFVLLLLVYFRFSPEGGLLLLLYPACSAAGIPFALPIAGGLLLTPVSGLAVAVGVILDQFLRFVSSNEAAILSTGINTDEMITRFQFLIDGILEDDVMVIYVIAVTAATVVVYIIRRLSIPYAWIIASGAGAIVQLIVLLIGAASANVQIGVGSAFLGVLVAFGIGVVLSFFAFNLDYSRTENTQFEDDDYYYYVKAVPKNLYARPKRTVKTINTHRSFAGGFDASSRRRKTQEAAWEEEPLRQEQQEVYVEDFTEDYTEDFSGEGYGGDKVAGPEGGEYTEDLNTADFGESAAGKEYDGPDYRAGDTVFEGELRTEFETYRQADFDSDAYAGSGAYRTDPDEF